MNETKFNYIIGVLVVFLFVFVFYIDNKVNVLEGELMSLSDRMDAVENVALGFGDSSAYEDLGYYDDQGSQYSFDETY